MSNDLTLPLKYGDAQEKPQTRNTALQRYQIIKPRLEVSFFNVLFVSRFYILFNILITQSFGSVMPTLPVSKFQSRVRKLAVYVRDEVLLGYDSFCSRYRHSTCRL